MKHYVESTQSKEDRLLNWHKFFTLLPRKIETDDPTKDVWVWLKTIERKKYYWRLGHDYKYRLIEEKEH